MFRIGTGKDCESVYRLICDMEQKQLPFDRFSNIYQKQLQDKRYVYLICEMEGTVIGILNLRLEEQLHHAEWIAEILEFAIDPACRGKGIGKKLFAYGCEFAKEAGCTQIEVACNQLRKATHRFYLREGMQNFHFKFSKSLIGIDFSENELGR